MAGVDDTSVGEVVAVESGGEIQVGRSAVAAWWQSFPSLQRYPLRSDQGYECRWGNNGCGESRTQRPGPHLPLYSATRRGPTNYNWVGRPRSWRGSKAQIGR
jgi:uncharacterized protein YodC (DUF2158 family)